MLRLLTICEYPALNGAEQSLLAMLPHLPGQQIDITVAGPGGGPLWDALGSRNIRRIAFDVRDPAGCRLPLDEVRRRVNQLLRTERPDVVHCNSLASGRWCGPVVAARKIPSVGHLRDLIKLSRPAVGDLNCHRRLLAVSQATREWHVAGGIRTDRLHVLYNGVDLQQFAPRPPTGYLHQELQLPRDAWLLGTIGQIGLRKGQDVLLEAVAPILTKMPHGHLLIVGERNSSKDEAVQFEAELRRRIQQLSLSAQVHWLGRRSDISRLLNELTLLVHAARQEPLGRVLLEAIAGGTPVVATDVGGTREILPGGYPWRVPANDPVSLGLVIQEALGQPELRRSLAAEARQQAERRFDVVQTARRFAEHLRAVHAESAEAR